MDLFCFKLYIYISIKVIHLQFRKLGKYVIKKSKYYLKAHLAYQITCQQIFTPLLLRVQCTSCPIEFDLGQDFLWPLDCGKKESVECGQKCQFRAGAFRGLHSYTPDIPNGMARHQANSISPAWVPEWETCKTDLPKTLVLILARSNQVPTGFFLSKCLL